MLSDAQPPQPSGTQPGADCATCDGVSTTPAGPDKEVLTESWDSREVRDASNHDVRDSGV